ncbi:protein unc-93 homolog A [Nematostella vectensis]|uniref:protein unc-93 homolog A n=1 Tax=Nematostella vectensis TaxID=45351 RepID=UPI002077199F|nr:protein unc-93 homolog A [Nematostella vectensis]
MAPTQSRDNILNENGDSLVGREVVDRSPKVDSDMDPRAMTAKQKRKEKFSLTLNIFFISCGFLFLFTAFQSLQNLQSSLNSDEGLGLASLCVIYASLIISCMFVPPYMIGRLGAKWALVVSMVSYVLYTVANYYPSWYTMIPASFLVGMSAAPLWSSKCAYLTTTGIRYSELSNETQETVVTRYFGIFFLIFQSGQIWGNLISSMVLQQGDAGGESFRENAAEVCGPNFCKMPEAVGNATEPLSRPEKKFVYTMLSIYLATGVVAVLLIILLLKKLTGKMSRKKDEETGLNLLIATLKHLKDPRMKLILPITFYSGIEQAFIFGDFTAAFVTCSLGVHRVGFVMICFGVTDAAFSFILGRLTKYTGRLPIFISGMLVHMTAIITMLTWRPDAQLIWVYYVLAALQGFCDAVWQTQINALYGCYFPDNQEPAFSNYRLWESLGFVVAFAYASFICINVKLYILLAVLLLGMLGYLISELVHRRMDQSSYEMNKESTEMAAANAAIDAEELPEKTKNV